METLLHNISQVLGITILHSLWQGLLIYLLLTIILSAMPTLSSAKKHNVSFAAVLLMATWFVSTLILEAGRVQWLANEVAAATIPYNYVPEPSVVSEAHPDNNYSYIIKGYLPYITVVYLIGLLFNILRLCFALRNISLVKQSLTPAGQLENAVKKFSQQLAIKKEVLVSYSRMVSVPGVIGYLKPILLMPVAITNHLTTAEVEAIILHELSHIKRNDYLLNILQQVVSVLLFFNPFALLINRIIDSERENCCDDEVIKITGQPLIYARALLTLEQSKPNNLQLALAATGKRYSLLNRIERIMTAKKLTVNVRHILAAVLLFALSLGSIAWLNPEIKDDRINLSVINPLTSGYLFQDTVSKAKPKKHKAYAAKPKPAPKAPKVTAYHIDDPEMERLSADIEKQGAVIEKIYSSAAFKKLNEELEKKGEQINAFYENPELKKLQEMQEKLSAEMEQRWTNNPEMEKMTRQMDELSVTVDKYYNRPAYKNAEKQLEKQSALLDKAQFNTPAYKKQLAEVSRLSRELSAQASAPEIKQKTEQMRQLGQQMRQVYQSEEYKKHREQYRAISDSLRRVYSAPQIKQQQEAMRALSQKMREFQNDPQIKIAQKRMQEATAKMRTYMNSPAYKKRIQQWQRDARIAMPDEPASPEEVSSPDSTLPEPAAVPDAPEPVKN